MKAIITAILILVSYNLFGQIHIDQISVGDVMPKNIDLGGFKEVQGEDCNCRVFSIEFNYDTTDSWTKQSIESQQDVTLATVIGIHFNSENIVVGVIKNEIWLSESKRLESYKYFRNYDMDLINRFEDYLLIANEESYNNDYSTKYYSYSIDNYGKGRINVIRSKGIVKSVQIEETYIPNSSYRPRFEFNNHIKSDELEKKAWGKDEFYTFCESVINEFENYDAEIICDCFYEKVISNFSNKEINNLVNDLLPIITQCISSNVPPKLKLLSNETPIGWRWIYNEDITGDWEKFKTDIPYPFQSIGDYNMDNLMDTTWVLLKSDNSGWGIFVFLTENDSTSYTYNIAEYDMNIKPQFINISTQNPGIYKTACGKGYWECAENEPKELNLRMQSIFVTPYESGGAFTIYWNEIEQKFNMVLMND